MQVQLPFSIFKRSRSKYWYVKFKDTVTGQYLPEKSTKKTSKDEAIKEAFLMMTNQKPSKTYQIKHTELSNDDLMLVLSEMQNRGLISSVTVTTETNKIKIVDYIKEFWDFEKSRYIKEKLRQGHSIHKTHANNMSKFIGKYWIEFFKDMSMGEISKVIIHQMFDMVATLDLSGHTKNVILRSVLTPFKFAYSEEILKTDFTQNLIWFSEKYNERKILTPELAHSLFTLPWKDERARLANALAMCTGMRAGEIRALRVRDIGQDCIYVNHSWSDKEGLKEPKNGETRIVQLPFNGLIKDLLKLAESSPFYKGVDNFVFYSTLKNQPIDTDIFINGLRDSLVTIGVSKDEAKEYVFHSWRHFFATYLSDKLSIKLLQQQTGHKTKAMLEHYAQHKTEKDKIDVQTAQVNFFTKILEKP